MAYQCTCKSNKTIVDVRIGDDSNFNNNHIIFHLSNIDLTGWKAAFQLQDIKWSYNAIVNHQVEVVITKQQSLLLQPGFCIGYLKLIDNQGREGTVKAQPFRIWPQEVRDSSNA